ncbi:glycosyltransferase [Litorivicinus sp.]|nr:glycosyltransferase [Litorivicinus sp.]
MKVSGFTFLRNAVINGYPFEESIRSILPIVDEFICVVGESQDETRGRVASIGDPKIRIIDSQWNESMQDRGFVYGQQKMIGQYNCSGDWSFYLEGDEVLHQDEIEQIYQSMEDHLLNFEVEALYFDFLHFYGTPDQVGIAGYRKAPRIIRNSIRTIAPDGLFWVVIDKNKRGRYPKAKYANGHIFHYGHCRNVNKMAKKLSQIGKYWGDSHADFVGYGNIDIAELRPFKGSHPRIMSDWIETEAERVFVQNPDYRISRRDRRNRVRFWLEEMLKVEISKKHYRVLD